MDSMEINNISTFYITVKIYSSALYNREYCYLRFLDALFENRAESLPKKEQSIPTSLYLSCKIFIYMQLQKFYFCVKGYIPTHNSVSFLVKISIDAVPLSDLEKSGSLGS